jgi:hypothetical protein
VKRHIALFFDEAPYGLFWGVALLFYASQLHTQTKDLILPGSLFPMLSRFTACIH